MMDIWKALDIQQNGNRKEAFSPFGALQWLVVGDSAYFEVC